MTGFMKDWQHRTTKLGRLRDWWASVVYNFKIKRDHKRWPLGTRVIILRGHHSPAAVGLIGKVHKHGSPCNDGVDCSVAFAFPVPDLTFGNPPNARYCHYVDYVNMERLPDNYFVSTGEQPNVV